MYPIQLKPFKEENRKDDGALGALTAIMTDVGINIHIPLTNFESHTRSSLQKGSLGESNLDMFDRKERKK